MQLQNYLHYSGQLTEPTEASRKKVQSATFAWEINYDHVFKTEIRRDGTEGSAQRSAAKANNKNNKVEKKQAFGKTFAISARGKTRAKRQREHAMGTLWWWGRHARWGACRTTAALTPSSPRQQACTDGELKEGQTTSAAIIARKRERDRLRGKKSVAERESVCYTLLKLGIKEQRK